MKTSVKGKVELVCHEGLSTQIYYDEDGGGVKGGVRTIGVGATVTEIPDIAHWPLTDSLSIPDVFELFGRSLIKYENAVNSVVQVNISQSQFDSLVSLCYNIGCGGLKSSSLVKSINAGVTGSVIYDKFMLWNRPPEIKSRRRQEAFLYTTGNYQRNGEAQLYETHGTGHIDRHAIKTLNVWKYITDK